MNNVAFSPIPEELRKIIRQLSSAHCSPEFPLAYEITFTCYGTRLYGDKSGSVDRNHNLPGSPYLPVCQSRVETIDRRLREPRLFLTPRYRKSVLAAVVEVCWYRGWIPLAVHVRTTHLHAVVHGLVDPEKIMDDFKAYATRALNEKHGLFRRKNWARHGSTRYRWTQEDVEAAARYVLFLKVGPWKCILRKICRAPSQRNDSSYARILAGSEVLHRESAC